MDPIVRMKAQSDDEKDVKYWGSLTWLTSGNLHSTNITVGRVIIKKGMSNPLHVHSNCEEVLYLLSGKLDNYVSDTIIPMEPGDTIVIPAGAQHRAQSVGVDDADMMVIYSSAFRDYENV